MLGANFGLSTKLDSVRTLTKGTGTFLQFRFLWILRDQWKMKQHNLNSFFEGIHELMVLKRHQAQLKFLLVSECSCHRWGKVLRLRRRLGPHSKTAPTDAIRHLLCWRWGSWIRQWVSSSETSRKTALLHQGCRSIWACFVVSCLLYLHGRRNLRALFHCHPSGAFVFFLSICALLYFLQEKASKWTKPLFSVDVTRPCSGVKEVPVHNHNDSNVDGGRVTHIGHFAFSRAA